MCGYYTIPTEPSSMLVQFQKAVQKLASQFPVLQAQFTRLFPLIEPARVWVQLRETSE